MNSEYLKAMTRLRHNEWLDSFTAINTLNSDINPDTLQERAVSAVNQVLSGVITAFDFFDENGVHTGENWYDPPGSITNKEFEIFAQVAHEHPCFPEVFAKNHFRTMKISDFYTTNEFRKTGIYNEFFRIFNIENQMLVPIQVSSDSIITCAISRTKDSFSENQRMMLTILSMQLRTAIINTKSFERIQKSEQILQTGFVNKSSGIIALNPDKSIVYATEFSRMMLEKYFAKDTPSSKCLPDKLKNWVINKEISLKTDNLSSSSETYFLSRENDQLTIRYMFNSQTNETTLLLEEKLWVEPQLLRKYSLTKRETEILFWLSQGKADKEIAIICNISPRTVQKHIERIYVKIGVETRTAAMLKVLDIE